MATKRVFPGPTIVACDFALGLAGFAVIVMALGVDLCGLSAHATELAWPPEFAAFDMPLPPELREPAGAAGKAPALALLGVAFATSVALNLWFARHLSRAYAGTRRGGEGR